MSYKTWNTIEHILQHTNKTSYVSNSGIYQFNCLDCPKRYVGQTRQTFSIRYKEHIHAVYNSKPDTGYSRHILHTGHTYTQIGKNMHIVKKARKGKLWNTLGKWYILLNSKNIYPWMNLIENVTIQYLKLQIKILWTNNYTPPPLSLPINHNQRWESSPLWAVPGCTHLKGLSRYCGFYTPAFQHEVDPCTNDGLPSLLVFQNSNLTCSCTLIFISVTRHEPMKLGMHLFIAF